MGYAYANIEAVEPPSYEAGWGGSPSPNPWPYPWPDPPYPEPDPDNPTPPGVDPDENGDTYQFSHIAKAIDNRQAMLGLSASGLPTTSPDRYITRANVNTARGFLEGYYDDFVKKTIVGKCFRKYHAPDAYYVDAAQEYYAYNDYHDLLEAAGVGGTSSSVTSREWYNQRSDGTWYFGNDMASDDIMSPTMFLELEMVLKHLINKSVYYAQVAFPGGRWYISASTYSSFSDAWSNRLSVYQNWPDGSYVYVKRDISGKTNYEVGAWAVANNDAGDDVSFTQTIALSASSVSYQRKFYLYKGPEGNTYHRFYDFVGVGFGANATIALADSTGWVTDTSKTLTYFNGTLNGYANWSKPSLSGLTWMDVGGGREEVELGFQNMQALGVVEYKFPEDERLGKTEK